MKKLLPVLFSLLIIGCFPNRITKTYEGIPWKLKTFPGKLECELYDKGGEGITYHDTDSVNNGSGKLNPANGNFLNEFRMKEGVDISYTKSNLVDNNPFNKTEPILNQLYVGWTVPREWINYSVQVKKTDQYKLGLMYTSNGDGGISFDIDGKSVTASLKIPTTHNDLDTIAWRQWHHWNKIDSLTTLHITKGKHVITLHITQQGNMNFDYIEFTHQ